ncbi:hypothetical protein SAMN04488103_108126 [Gemmobacter aquatilis]|uniref:Oxidoreductase molybdopterin-binding domain-containing protein n=1 Tax=Gemmobacter aquatilis TaxID=933059 RepID=A0A1H8JWV0_9RHOB|nr:hypothetical protein [Gemmobacter aquatilis]SEN85189.1 hypothetical protein SAMN04488103_108126 [Gemmobacter aquatilis]
MQVWRFAAGWQGRTILAGAGAMLLALLLQAALSVAWAQEGVLLTVTDAAGNTRSFDRAALETLPQQSFTTTTIWTDGVLSFSGPPLRVVLAAAGIKGGRVELAALNDYVVELDLAETTETVPIIATRQNGQAFDVRENGPLWVLYPYDSTPDFQTEPVYASSVWQIVAVRALVP